MSIIVERIVSHTDDTVRAIVNHKGSRLDVDVAGPISRVKEMLGQSLTAEIGYARMVNIQVLERDNELAHGLFQSDPSIRQVRIVGRVENVLPLDDGDSIFDVYVQTGPEFLAFDSTEHEIDLKVGDPVAIVVQGLCFYPTWI
jgi:hypothetical protein